jgi:hypothetical protein
MDKAVIAEQVNEAPVVMGTSKDTTTFRIVIWTQTRENYGAHSWDGTGECPQHWKSKCGSEYHIPVGTANDVLTLGSEGLETLVDKAIATGKIEQHNESFEESVMGWEIVPSTQLTWREKCDKDTYENGLRWDAPQAEKDAWYEQAKARLLVRFE